ncbi:MAG: hypothetical protein JWQ25_762 [Daejeonella sp.]|nr:hypothetical protein [Daejeonella sp.]
MKNILLIVLLSTTLLFSCSKDRDMNFNVDSVAYFEKHLDINMDNEAVVAMFGKPDAQIGSGLYIYVYDLKDGTQVIIGCGSEISYANHVTKDGALIKKLITR